QLPLPNPRPGAIVTSMGATPEVILPSDRKFGLTFSVLLGLLGAWAAWRSHGSLAIGSATLAMSFLLAAILAPPLLHPLNRAWMALGAVLSRVVSPLVMGIVFFLLVTPTALVGRALGRDELRLRPDS